MRWSRYVMAKRLAKRYTDEPQSLRMEHEGMTNQEITDLRIRAVQSLRDRGHARPSPQAVLAEMQKLGSAGKDMFESLFGKLKP